MPIQIKKYNDTRLVKFIFLMTLYFLFLPPVLFISPYSSSSASSSDFAFTTGAFLGGRPRPRPGTVFLGVLALTPFLGGLPRPRLAGAATSSAAAGASVFAFLATGSAFPARPRFLGESSAAVSPIFTVFVVIGAKKKNGRGTAHYSQGC